jgi:glucose-6-phosphate 1-dehydrogenase
MKTTLVIFGITGDLSTRKLIPALEHILDSGEFDDLHIVGVSRRALNVGELIQTTLGHDRFKDVFSGFTLDFSSVSDYKRLGDSLVLNEENQVLIYLAVPPGAATTIVDLMGEAGLNSPHVKLLFEKPFGFDLGSAQDFIERTARYFSDEQIYRIDHYLAKEVSQEIIRLRSNAENHHHSWSNQSISAIDIVASEKIGIEDRANFYEQTGALRDFIQGHLLQLLALVLLEVPDDFTEEKLPEYRLAALDALLPPDPRHTIRGQYEGYSEIVHNQSSQTETFVNVPISSGDTRWQGVPIRLISG